MDRGLMLSTILHGALAAAVIAVVHVRPKPVVVTTKPIPVEIYTQADVTRLAREVSPRKDRPAAKPGKADLPPARARPVAIDKAVGEIETDANATPVSTPPAARVDAGEAPPPPVARTPKRKPRDAVAQVAPAPEPKPLVRPTPQRTAERAGPDDFGLVLRTVAAIKQRQGEIVAAPPAPVSRPSAPVSRALPPIGPAQQIPLRPGTATRADQGRSAATAGVRRQAVSGNGTGSGRPVQTARRGQAGTAADYYAEVEAWLKKHQHYPPAAKRASQEGKVVVEFTMNRAGRVLSHRVLKSSGHRLLDRAAERTVMIAAPLPPVPPIIPDRRLTLMFSIKYDAD